MELPTIGRIRQSITQKELGKLIPFERIIKLRKGYRNEIASVLIEKLNEKYEMGVMN